MANPSLEGSPKCVSTLTTPGKEAEKKKENIDAQLWSALPFEFANVRKGDTIICFPGVSKITAPPLVDQRAQKYFRGTAVSGGLGGRLLFKVDGTELERFISLESLDETRSLRITKWDAVPPLPSTKTTTPPVTPPTSNKPSDSTAQPTSTSAVPSPVSPVLSPITTRSLRQQAAHGDYFQLRDSSKHRKKRGDEDYRGKSCRRARAQEGHAVQQLDWNSALELGHFLERDA